MKAEVISIGTELLLGDITDTNATYIAQRLREVGLDLLYRTTIGDNEERIAQVVDIALNRADVVITTGGLGPTVDDVTREGIARATGRPLEFKQQLLEQIAERFRRFTVSMSENNHRQAYVPQGSLPVENPVGTAPIFILETERGVVMVLPGVPREMKHLLDNDLLPWLRDHVGAPAVITSLVLRTAGIGESQIDAKIADLMTMSNPTVGLAAHPGQTDIRITAKAESDERARALIAPVEDDIRQRLGWWIFGTDAETLPDVVMQTLKLGGSSVATVEAGTGGSLAAQLDTVKENDPATSGERRVLASWDDLTGMGVDIGTTLAGAAEAAARAVRQQAGMTYGVAVIMRDELPAGDDSGSGTAIAIASGETVRTRTYNWTSIRTDAPTWAATQALALLRRMLIKQGESE